MLKVMSVLVMVSCACYAGYVMVGSEQKVPDHAVPGLMTSHRETATSSAEVVFKSAVRRDVTLDECADLVASIYRSDDDLSAILDSQEGRDDKAKAAWLMACWSYSSNVDHAAFARIQEFYRLQHGKPFANQLGLVRHD